MSDYNMLFETKCYLCDGQMDTELMPQHMLDCIKKYSKPSDTEDIHLAISLDEGNTERIEVVVRPTVTLDDLDRFLRGVWLECCGHDSFFRISTTEEFPEIFKDDFGSVVEDTSKLIAELITPETIFRYDYMAPQSHPLIIDEIYRCGDVIGGMSGPSAIETDTVRIVARNVMADRCDFCYGQAYWIAVNDDATTYCHDCKQHETTRRLNYSFLDGLGCFGYQPDDVPRKVTDYAMLLRYEDGTTKLIEGNEAWAMELLGAENLV